MAGVSLRRRHRLITACSTFSLCLCSAFGHGLHAAEPSLNPPAPVDVIWFPNPPYAVDAQGVPSGLEIDLWRMIAETRQIPYRIRRAESFESLIEQISSGEADLAISGVLINENRSKIFQFSFPTASSNLKLYKLEKKKPTAIKLLRIILSREVLLIFIGLILIACLFAIPVWLLERHRQDFSSLRKRHQLIFILQKTLLLSTDHTKRSKSRIISIGSLFARVLLTAYFASYVLKLSNEASTSKEAKTESTVQAEIQQQSSFATIPGYIQTSILKSNGAKTVACNIASACVALLQQGRVDAILDDEQTIQATLDTMPASPKVSAASGALMPLFMAFAFSNRFSQDPRAQAINIGISRSYYDGSYSKLKQHWMTP